MAVSSPSGNGPVSGWRFTKCAAGTLMRAERPGSAWSFDGITSFVRDPHMATSSWISDLTRPVQASPFSRIDFSSQSQM